MRIATYNLLKGGTKRTHWKEMIESHLVDLLLTQESARPDLHLTPDMFPDFQKQFVWEMSENKGWGSAIFSRDGRLEAIQVPGFSGWAVGAKITNATWQRDLCESIFVFSLHAPELMGGYAKAVNKFLDEVKMIAGQNEVIIGGDFNLTVSRWLSPEKKISKHDLAIQARLADEFALMNCWQEANPGQELHQTLRWTNNRETVYHCDGIFVPKSWKSRLQSCRVLSGEEWDRLSDHNPVVATFG